MHEITLTSTSSPANRPVYSMNGTCVAFITSDDLVFSPKSDLLGHMVGDDLFTIGGTYLATLERGASPRPWPIELLRDRGGRNRNGGKPRSPARRTIQPDLSRECDRAFFNPDRLPPPSTTDRIAKYTRQFPAGTFNRPYSTEIVESGKRAVVRLTYDAPDVVPSGARFEKTLTLEPATRAFVVDERVSFAGDDAQAAAQRGVSMTSLSVGSLESLRTQITLTPEPGFLAVGSETRVAPGNALGVYDSGTHELATIAWRPGDLESATLSGRGGSALARFVLAPNRTDRTVYGYDFVPTLDAARARLAEIATAVAQGHAPPPPNDAK